MLLPEGGRNLDILSSQKVCLTDNQLLRSISSTEFKIKLPGLVGNSAVIPVLVMRGLFNSVRLR